MQLTTLTIDRRAALFRNLVVGIVAITIISVLWAMVQFSWIPLTGLLFLVLLCAVFFCLDIKKTDRWQHQIMAMWHQGNLDLVSFGQAMATLRVLPQHTLQGMLATLPVQPAAQVGQSLNGDIKRAVALTLQTINQCHFDRTAGMGIAMMFGFSALALTLILWSWLPLMGIMIAWASVAAYQWLQWYRLHQLQKKIEAVVPEQGADMEKLVAIMAALDWGAISEKKKKQTLNALRP